MRKITVHHDPNRNHLTDLNVYSWPIWEKEVSEFPWVYEEKETCFFLEGEVLITPDEGDPVMVGKNDLVTFPKGFSCTWKIIQPVKKYYSFG